MNKHPKKPGRLSFETLEPRIVMSASTTTATSTLLNLLYSINGSGNNLTNTTWGQAGTDLYREILAAAYADGVSALNDKSATNSLVTLPSAGQLAICWALKSPAFTIAATFRRSFMPGDNSSITIWTSRPMAARRRRLPSAPTIRNLLARRSRLLDLKSIQQPAKASTIH